MKEPVLVFGAGGHAKVIIDILEKQGKYKIVGILDDSVKTATALGYPVLGPESRLGEFKVTQGIVAIGDNWARSKLVERIGRLAPGFQFVVAIHPSAQIGKDVEIGPGSVVMAGTCINPSTKIGSHCIVNTASSIDHDCAVEDFASIGPGATLGGNCKIGKMSMVGLGASIIHQINVGEHALIGAGAAVVEDIPQNVVAVGTPARIVKERQPGSFLI
ncbi:MAG: acetyltransferase [Bdellovibrionota bacterium]